MALLYNLLYFKVWCGADVWEMLEYWVHFVMCHPLEMEVIPGYPWFNNILDKFDQTLSKEKLTYIFFPINFWFPEENFSELCILRKYLTCFLSDFP